MKTCCTSASVELVNCYVIYFYSFTFLLKYIDCSWISKLYSLWYILSLLSFIMPIGQLIMILFLYMSPFGCSGYYYYYIAYRWWVCVDTFVMLKLCSMLSDFVCWVKLIPRLSGSIWLLHSWKVGSDSKVSSLRLGSALLTALFYKW